MIFRFTNSTRHSLFSGPSFRAALFCALIGLLGSVLLPGCRGDASEAADEAGAPDDGGDAILEPPEAYPGVIDLPRATDAGFFRCETPIGAAPGLPANDNQAPGGKQAAGGAPAPGGSEAAEENQEPGDEPRPAAGSQGPALLSSEFVREYLVTPPWVPSMPSFLPVDPEEHRRWMRLMELTSRFLFRWDPDTGSWQPDAADSAEFDPGARTLTVRLQEELSWSDGTPATAADWVRSVEEIYQRPGIQSPLRDHTAAGGALWEAVDELTLTVTFESLPRDPLRLLAIPPLPFSDLRIRSLASGNIDALYDLEVARDILPRLTRSGGQREGGADDRAPGAPGAPETNRGILSPPIKGEAILGTTGASRQALIVLVPSDSPLHPLLPTLLGALNEKSPIPDLFLLREAERPQGGAETHGAPAERSPTSQGPAPQEARVAYSFGSPAARAAASFFGRELEALGVEETSLAPENARVLDRQLPRLLSGDRELPGDLVIAEVTLDPTFAIPLSLLGTLQEANCPPEAVEGLNEWYNCLKSYRRQELPVTGIRSRGSIVLTVLGRLPRLVLLSPSACFDLPVPPGARAIDLLEIPGESGEGQES